MRIPAVLGLGLLALACAPKDQAPQSMTLSAADLDAVKAVDVAFAAAMSAKDTAAAFAVYAPEAKILPPDAPILEGDAVHAALTGLIAGGAGDFVFTPTVTYGVGDLAYSVGTVTYSMGGAPQQAKYSEVFRKGADGKWRYVVDMFSGVAPPADAAAPKKN